jgi:hypothetical protein
MDTATITKLKGLLKAVPLPGRGKPWYFAFTPEAGVKGETKEPLLVVDKAPVTRANLLPQAKKLLGIVAQIELLGAKKVYVGRVDREGMILNFHLDTSKSPDGKVTETFRKAVKTLGDAIKVPELQKHIVDALSSSGQTPDDEHVETMEEESESKPSGGDQDTPAPERPRSSTAPAVVVPSEVVINKSKIVWMAARSTASSELDKLLAAIYGDPEVRAKPELRQMAGTLKKSGWKMDAFDERLVGALDDLKAATTPDAQESEMARCRALLAGYRSALDGDATLQAIDDNPFVKVKVYSTLKKGIDGVYAALKF